jgi:hypothetical protein
MKVVAPRNFKCPMTDYEEPCTDGRCTRKKCVLQIIEEPRPPLPQDPSPVSGKVLLIEFDPRPQHVFKAALLKHKRAMRTVHYQDGHIEHWPWKAAKFTQTSDLIDNVLTSRLRHWRRDGISRVEIKILASG